MAPTTRNIKTCDKCTAPIKYRRSRGAWVAYDVGTLIRHTCAHNPGAASNDEIIIEKL